MKSKHKLSETVSFSLPHKELLVPVCIICLKKINTILSPTSTLLPAAFKSANRNDQDLYKLFLYFCKRYLKLKNADRFLEAYSKSKDGGGSSPHFCEACHQLMGYLLDVYVELNGLQMQLLSKIKELGEIVKKSKKSVSSKLGVGQLRQVCIQLNISNYLVIDQLRRKLVEKCSAKTQTMLPTVVLERHEKTVATALVALIILFSLIYDWDLWKISDSYSSTSQKFPKEGTKSKLLKIESNVCMKNDITDDSGALCIPDTIPLKRTRTKISRRTATPSRSSTRVQSVLPSINPETTGEVKSDLMVPKEEMGDHEDDGNYFGEDPEWMPSGCDEDYEPGDDDSQFPPVKVFKEDDTKKTDNPNSSSKVTALPTKKRRRRRKLSPSSVPRRPGRPPKDPFCVKINDPSTRCKECNIDFKTRYLFIDHMAMIHEACESPFECQTCQKQHDGFRKLRTHLIQLHEDPENKPFYCRFCDQSYSTQQHCDIHRRMTHFTIPHLIFCDDDECQEEFDSDKDQNDHLKSHLTAEQTPEENIFICKKCSKGYLSKHRLQLHELTHWSKDDSGFFKCDLCYVNYRNTSVMMSHYNRIHMGENKITIHRCEVKTCLLYEITKKELNTHKSRHELTKEISIARLALLPIKNIKRRKKRDDGVVDDGDNEMPTNKKRKQKFFGICEECGYKCVSRSRLQRHKFVHGDPQFTCPVCLKKFRRQDHLTIHINRIHDKSNLLICELCGKACPTKAELKYHRSEHDMRYQCKYCPMRFSRRTVLSGHERTHTGEKLQCEWCPVSKACLYNIKTHVKKCHPEEYKIHYADGARTQYRYKIMKAAAEQKTLNLVEMSLKQIKAARPDEPQLSTSNNLDDLLTGNVDDGTNSLNSDGVIGVSHVDTTNNYYEEPSSLLPM